MKKALKIILIIIVSLSLILLTFFLIKYFSANKIEIREDSLKKNFLNLEVFDNSMKPLEVETKYQYVPFEDISKSLIDAFISIEDKRFFEHNGVDARGIARAIVKNLMSMSYREGASTISQQLVKNTILNNEKSIDRKIKEINLAVRLEKTYDKEQILSMYLSAIYFGHGQYGLKEASNFYFNKEPSQLSIAEAATLAGLVRSPNNYSPINDPNSSKMRRNLVLQAMIEQGRISESEYIKAKSEEILLSEKTLEKEKSSFVMDYILKEAESILGVSEKELRSSNMKIYTSLDSSISEKIFHDKLLPEHPSLVVIAENSTGNIISLFENIKNSLNLPRSPASLLKPIFVFAPALNEGFISPLTIIEDKEASFDGYSPRNFKNLYYGNVLPRIVLSKSLNIPSVKVYESIPKAYRELYARRLGIELTSVDGLSVALGTLQKGLSPKTLLGGYCALGNYGKMPAMSFIKKIVSDKNEIIYEKKNGELEEVFSEETSSIISDFLKDTAKVGTAKKLSSLRFELSAKTGTNGTEKGNTDAWCVAYNEKYTVLSWVGNGETLLPNDITGSSLPLKMTSSAFEKLDTSKSDCMKIRGEIKRVEIDSYSLEKDKIPKLATENVPKKYVVSEYIKADFFQKLQPSTAFDKPEITDAQIEISSDILTLTFSSEKIYRYEILYGDETFNIDGTGSRISLNFELNDSSEHYIEIIPSLYNGEISGEPFRTKSIFTKKNLLPPKDDWWNNYE